jgi:catechol 2,3-dioxygenase
VESDRPGLEHYGWRVGSLEDLTGYEKTLGERGVETEWFEGEPGQDRGLRFTDPAGMTAELYWEMDAEQAPTNRHGIAPERLSHIVFATSAVDEVVSLYCDVFGFKVSDVIQAPDGTAGCFMRCGPMHHTLAVLRAPIPGALHHIAWQVPSFEALKSAADVLSQTGNEIEYGPGRHGIGQNTYLYFRDPDRMRM